MAQFAQIQAIYLGNGNNNLWFLGGCLLNYKKLKMQAF